MWKQSVWTSTISSHLASLHLKPGGLLTLSGAKASVAGTPGKTIYYYTPEICHPLENVLPQELQNNNTMNCN